MHAGEASNAYFLAKRLADRKAEAHVLTTEGYTGGADSGITVHPIMRNRSWGEMFRMRGLLPTLLAGCRLADVPGKDVRLPLDGHLCGHHFEARVTPGSFCNPI